MAGDGDGSGSVAPDRIYALLLGCFRVAWVCCTVAVAAMLPALVLRSTAFVAVFEIGLACCFTALGAATLVAVLLADLLDRD